MLELELDVTSPGLSLEGCVRKANASFSVLNGTVSATPDSSPSETLVILAPGYFDASSAFALSISAWLKPCTVTFGPPSRRDLGRRNLRPTVTVPSALKVALVSYPHATAASSTAATSKVLATVSGTAHV